ncbi:hypothetical protein [Lactobacillus phage Semele]|uniref:Uncharacterized protein n=1 Tax=Lactobacillus phage Semele TaxID=2079433 RepID=A0A2K9VD65_9CAUD|nr:hypothetical protein HOS80_gp119 [Lactobacillus phage Semele]AUV60145.1 hypothetical protein [Lactobacillus phage Semele]
MTASEKLQKLIENDKLTDEQLDNLNDWGIEQVSDVRSYLINLINQLKDDDISIDYEKAIIALYDLLDYNEDDDYVVYDEDGVQELDFESLNDALGID